MAFLIFFGAGMLLVGLAGIIVGLLTRKAADETAAWRTTTGKVLLSQVRTGKYPVSPEAAPGTPAGEYHEPLVRYAYHIDEQEYIGGRCHTYLLPHAYGQARSQALCALYPAGRAVTVHYNPDRPQRAVLATSLPPLRRYPSFMVGAWFTGLGILVTALGIVLVVFVPVG